MDDLLPPGSLFLGFDCSTQSLKATILDHNLNTVKSLSLHYDSDLPHYKTVAGTYRDTNNAARIVSPTLMWVEALDLILERLKECNVEFAKITAISGSGQQHGSVYWNYNALDILQCLDGKQRLVDQMVDAFSVKESPIWMDYSTTSECKQIEDCVGGAYEMARITGSRAYERFTGPQIRKIYHDLPMFYESTSRISLVSSFMASILIGKFASIDYTDGAGMNLLDIKQKDWSDILLKATAPKLSEKLGTVAPAHEIAGLISRYFVERYGFSESCVVVNWSGDNPNSLAGLGLSETGDLGISLGTSDTVFAISKDPKPLTDGHVFPNPVDPESYMVMLCYRNGSLTREEFRNRYAAQSWEKFNELLQQAPPLNNGRMGFYYTDEEIVPPLPAGYHRYLLKSMEGGNEEKVKEEFDAAGEVRALVEGQFVSKRGHAERFGLPSPPKRLMATGGASANPAILNVLGGVFGCDVHTVERPDSASLGAAVRAAHGWLCHRRGAFVPMQSLYDRMPPCKVSAKAGHPQLVAAYAKIIKYRMAIETRIL